MGATEQQKGRARGKEYGPYTVYERLGVGGMATVHRAKERGIEGFERIVALKRLLPHLAEDEEFVKSFVREARFASLLQHGNIAQLYELGRVGESYFIAMEYVEGWDLRRCLKQARRAAGPPSLEFTLHVLMQLCDALDYAHNRADDAGQALGLVHRDISPSNLIVSSEGHLKIIDFGIAKATAANEATRSGAIKGKLAYLAPECLSGNVDARTDIFSTGVVAHELLCARPLFADKNDFRVIHNIQHLDPEPPSKRNKDSPAGLDEIVLKALAKDPMQRWQSARAMLDALRQIARDHNVHTTSRDVIDWIEYAFSLPTDMANRPYQSPDSSVSQVTFPSMVQDPPDSIVLDQPNAPLESFLPAHQSGTGPAIQTDESAFGGTDGTSLLDIPETESPSVSRGAPRELKSADEMWTTDEDVVLSLGGVGEDGDDTQRRRAPEVPADLALPPESSLTLGLGTESVDDVEPKSDGLPSKFDTTDSMAPVTRPKSKTATGSDPRLGEVDAPLPAPVNRKSTRQKTNVGLPVAPLPMNIGEPDEDAPTADRYPVVRDSEPALGEAQAGDGLRLDSESDLYDTAEREKPEETPPPAGLGGVPLARVAMKKKPVHQVREAESIRDLLPDPSVESAPNPASQTFVTFRTPSSDSNPPPVAAVAAAPLSEDEFRTSRRKSKSTPVPRISSRQSIALTINEENAEADAEEVESDVRKRRLAVIGVATIAALAIGSAVVWFLL